MNNVEFETHHGVRQKMKGDKIDFFFAGDDSFNVLKVGDAWLGEKLDTPCPPRQPQATASTASGSNKE